MSGTNGNGKIDRNDKRALLARFKAPQDLNLKASGIVAEVVRPPVGAWIAAGQVPELLYSDATGLTPEQKDERLRKAIEETPAMVDFAIKVMRSSFKWPKLTEEGRDASDEDELDPTTLAPPDYMTIINWAMGAEGSIQTTDGEVDAGKLRTFREGEAVSGDSSSVRDVQTAPGAGVGGS